MANGQLSTPRTVICTDPRALHLDAAYRFTALSAATTRNGALFSVALAGGNTPAQLYRLLASTPFKEAIDWERIHLFFGDERAVLMDSQYSNYKMVNETLLSHIEIPARNIHRIRAEQPDTGAAADDYAAEITTFFLGAPLPRFDLILLGMGADGHCASIFPNAPALREQSRLVVGAEAGLQPFVPRVTLTLPAINNAANVLFLVSGADKADTLKQVLNPAPNAEELPSQAVRPTNGTLTWLLDRAAAGLH